MIIFSFQLKEFTTMKIDFHLLSAAPFYKNKVDRPAFFRSFLLIINVTILLFTNNLTAKVLQKPSAYAQLDPSLYQKFSAPKFNKSHPFTLPISQKKTAEFKILTQHLHANNDVSIQAQTLDKKGFINATLGVHSIFGQMHYEDKDFLLTTDASGSWKIELPQSGMDYNSCGHKLHKNHGIAPNKHYNNQTSTNKTVIDLMIVYNQALQERYPGDLMQTRLNQYMNVANQATANTELSLVFRLVGSEYLPYNKNDGNSTVLNNLYNSLSGEVVLGMEDLKQRREQLGADIVVFMRPHDIITRGSCGVAVFPYTDDGINFDSNVGIQVVSEGMSSWSICTDQVMIHELGHNLGAGHNDVPLESRMLPDASAFAKPGQFTTIMGSFGTGQPTRFFELDAFSNPNIQCAGVNCGILNESNNANVINQYMAIVARYQPSISQLPIPQFSANNPDHDGDGVNDWHDFFPFDAPESIDTDLDGVGDNSDAFVTDSSEQYDFDGDGIGNNLDDDDDNDGIEDITDAFPFNPLESLDSDNDGVGDNTDSFPNDYTEQQDFDSDGIGDHSDQDDDDDSYTDLDDSLQDLLIINTGSNQIVRIDAQTGGLHGVEVLSTDGLLTFQSDLTYRKESQTLFYTSSSAVKKLDLMKRSNKQNIYLPAYDDNGGAQIGTGFPTSLSSLNANELAIGQLYNQLILTVNGQEVVHPIVSQRWFLNYSFRPIDMVTRENETFVLDALGVIYKGQPSQYYPDVVTESSGIYTDWLDKPYALTINSNNKLYISDQNSNTIVRLDTSGENIEENFITLTDLGYSKPTGLVITNDNILLVAAANQNSILKFNADSGDFLGVLLKESGLNKPHKMILVPKLRDRYHHDKDKVLRPNAGFWYNPDTNGRGFDIHIFENFLSVIWYTYDNQGSPIWYISSGELEGFEYSGDLNKTHLNADGSVSLTKIGSTFLSFSDERNAQVDWQINSTQGSESLQWIVWSNEEESKNYTGLWNRPDAPGWGISVSTIGKTSVGIAYLYDSQGEPRWLISDPVQGSAPLNLELKAVFSQTLCPSCSGVSSFNINDAGTMTLGLDTDYKWNSTVVFPPPLNGSWLLDNTTIEKISSESIRPR